MHAQLFIKLLYTGADPKSVVCAFFKQGQCSKGDKCKFSHDITLDRKGEKRSIYVDARDAEDDLKNGTHYFCCVFCVLNAGRN